MGREYKTINVQCYGFSPFVLDFRSRRKTADAMRLPLQFYLNNKYFILLCTVIVAKIKSVYLDLISVIQFYYTCYKME